MTATPEPDFQSLTGALESAEPAPATPAHDSHDAHDAHDDMRPPAGTAASAGPAQRSAGTPADHARPASGKPQALAATRPFTVAGSPSTLASPLSSRDASPARPPQRNAGAQTRSGLRSRKSSTDVSPSRGPAAATPSAAAIQRALSSASTPQLASASSSTAAKPVAPAKASPGSNSGETTPRWPLSPRLQSPPPGSNSRSRSRTNSLRNQVRKPDAQSTPAIVVQSSSPAPVSRIPVREESVHSDPDEPVLSMKAVSRGASGVSSKLETVQESSLPATPGFDGVEPDSFVAANSAPKAPSESRSGVSSTKVTEDLSTSHASTTSNTNSSSRNTGSGSDTAKKQEKKGKMQEQRSSSTQRPHHITTKPSLSSLSTRSRSEAPTRNMTVETETIPSVAQSTLGGQDRSASGRGDASLRLKPSNETIRPKKERKPPKRKAPSINSGTASSKADVFEQKVASAVDEANSSDSEATFIYESNPPEQPTHRSRHNHSRTPSLTSIASLADQRLAMRDVHKNPGKKNSMKFSNAYANTGLDEALERGEGTIRIGSGRMTGSHHHHIGRHGQGRGALSNPALDDDLTLAQSSRARGASSRQASQPNSPHFQTFAVANGNGTYNGSRKSQGESSVYDIDAENVADDERTPLILTGRSPRRTVRRRNSANLRIERRPHHSGGWCRRFASCLVLSILLLVVIFSSVGLIYATTKPLTSVMARDIQNVVASQDELMLDLIVNAINPNIIGVTVSDMDVTIFAKSKHVGSDKWWRHHGNGPHDNEEDWQPIGDTPISAKINDDASGGVDEGTDPIDGEPRTMSLGHISQFDSPLIFDGSFFARKRAEAIGEIRLRHPGNKTEAGGTERWEEVLQYPFELIVRGNLRYQLPLSTREHKVSITASYYYDPDAEKKKKKMQIEAQAQRSAFQGRYARAALPLLGV